MISLIHGEPIHGTAQIVGCSMLVAAIGTAWLSDSILKSWIASSGHAPPPAGRQKYRAYVRAIQPELPLQLRKRLKILEYLSIGGIGAAVFAWGISIVGK